MALNHRNSKAVLLRVEEDGTRVYRKNHKILRAAPSTQPSGFYAPYCGRRAFLAATGSTHDIRNTKWFAEAVRERRQQGFTAGVKPGPQKL